MRLGFRVFRGLGVEGLGVLGIGYMSLCGYIGISRRGMQGYTMDVKGYTGLCRVLKWNPNSLAGVEGKYSSDSSVYALHHADTLSGSDMSRVDEGLNGMY